MTSFYRPLRVICSQCDQWVLVSIKTGKLRTHRLASGEDHDVCPGSSDYAASPWVMLSAVKLTNKPNPFPESYWRHLIDSLSAELGSEDRD
jgi:hypothetical protein